MSVTLKNGSVYEYGCMLAGHRGWRIGADSVDIAAGEGMKLTCHDKRALTLWADGNRDVDGKLSIAEHVVTLTDKADEHLNSLVPDDINAAFIWEDGELYFVPIDEEGESVWE